MPREPWEQLEKRIRAERLGGKEVMKMVIDEKLWAEVWLDTPINSPKAASAFEAMQQPGCAVKSKERGANGWPAHLGRLASFDKNGYGGVGRVVVRGYGDDISPKFVWTGTVAEYHAVWECD